MNNITSIYQNPVVRYINKNWTPQNSHNNTKGPTCIERNVFARAGFFALVLCTPISCAIDTIIGSAAALITFGTCGSSSRTFKFAFTYLESTKRIIVGPYMYFLQTINPKANFQSTILATTFEPLITQYPIHYLNALADNCDKSSNILIRHIASRITYIVLAIACVVTRVVDMIFGVIGFIFSLLTLGYVDTLNVMAVRGLQLPGMISDLFYCIVKTANPWADEEMKKRSERAVY